MIALLTMSIGVGFRNVTRYGLRGKDMYCAKHGYDFVDADESIVDTTKPIPWSKVRLIQEYLNKKYDYIVWVDGDTHIMNMEIKLEDLIAELSGGSDLMFVRDWQVINTGVMFIKCSDWSRTFWDQIWDMSVNTKYHVGCWEQDAIQDCMDANVDFVSSGHIHVCPWPEQRRFNSYWYNWEPNDFILHFAGCFRCNVGALHLMMRKFCPIKMDDETDGDFDKRKLWLDTTASADMKKHLENTR